MNKAGLMFVDLDGRECDVCDEYKICASVSTLGMDVLIICADCLKYIVRIIEG